MAEFLRDNTNVTLSKGFYMGIHLVTQEQWIEVMDNNPSKFKGEKNLPVETVSWDDCQKFIKKLRKRDKKPYRLPSDAEWEYACRAGTTTPFHFGQTISTDQANYNGNFAYGSGKKGVHRQKTTPAGSFPANAWGLHDMHGNLWQWCQDWYEEYMQDPKGPVIPKGVVRINGGGLDPKGPEKGECRVVRGGSFDDEPKRCRSAYRQRILPDDRDCHIGVRVCFSAE
jgi:formylglycine-generating enzyme required for sulfatase activity